MSQISFDATAEAEALVAAANGGEAGESKKDAPKRPRKLEKDLTKYPGKVCITVIDGAEGEMIFDPADLPENVMAQLPAFALGHKLGDSAAGKSGTEAEEAIKKVWEGLVSGDWTVKAPAAQRIPVKDVEAKYAELSDEEKEAAKKLLASLGINIPGV